MHNPADLPQELFDKILGYTGHDGLDLKSLCDFCLVDRQWYVTASVRIFSKWMYDGDKHSFLSLWNFLRTILGNTGIATLVRTLDIRNWGFHPGNISEANCHIELPQEDLEMVRRTIRKAGLHELERDIIDALHKTDRRPLMALLLTCLPNLTSMYAHVPESDEVLSAVLK
jgi:hypothetical protein